MLAGEYRVDTTESKNDHAIPILIVTLTWHYDRFRGGGTDIAKALEYAYTNNFAASRGARENVEKVLVLITDGVSDGAEPIAKVNCFVLLLFFINF